MSGRGHDQRRKNPIFRAVLQTFVTGVVAFGLFSPAMAGPYEDLRAARKRGDFATYLAIVRPLADRGEARAQTDLGALYRDGDGVAKDEAQAVLWFRKAADQGYPDGKINLGQMYEFGSGVPEDRARAGVLYRQVGEHGSADGWAMLQRICKRNRPAAPSDCAKIPKGTQSAPNWSRDPHILIGLAFRTLASVVILFLGEKIDYDCKIIVV